MKANQELENDTSAASHTNSFTVLAWICFLKETSGKPVRQLAHLKLLFWYPLVGF
jgi:hypothetical protein